MYDQKFIVWLCPDCGRTIKWPMVSTGAPNTICQCSLPDHVTQMTQVWPRIDDEMVEEISNANQGIA